MKKESAWNVGRLLVVMILMACVSAVSAYLVIRRHSPYASMFSPIEASPSTLAGLENAFGAVAQRLEPAVVTVTVRGKPRAPHVVPFSFPRSPLTPEQFKKFFEQFDIPVPRRQQFRFEFPGAPKPDLHLAQGRDQMGGMIMPPGMGDGQGGMMGTPAAEGESPQKSEDDTPPTPEVMGVGSGVIVRKDGYILTNAHVVREAEQVDVTLDDSTILKAKVVGQDRRGDVAVLKVEAKRDLPAATLGDSDKVKVGQWAIAIGNPVNLKGTVSVGVVSGLKRSLGNLSGLIQTDVAITSGSSGGPLCNLRGEIIGINTMITREAVGGGIPFEGGVTGYGFAIPINAAKRAMEDLIAKGKVSYGYLGIWMEPLSAEQASKAQVKKGVSVRTVTEGAPGEKAGVKVGDIITHVDGKEVGSATEMQMEIRKRRAGDKVKLSIVRDKKRLEVVAQLAELPEEVPPPTPRPRGEEAKPKVKPESHKDQSSPPSQQDPDEPSEPPTPKPDIQLHTWRGVTVQTLDDEARTYYKLPKDMAGVLISGVEQESPAYKAGLDAGDVIQAIDNQKVKTIADFERVTKSRDGKKPVQVSVKRKGKVRTVKVAP